MSTKIESRMNSAMQILTQCRAQGSVLSAVVVCLISAVVVVYWHPSDVYRTNNLLNLFITAQDTDLMIISSLFLFLYLSSSIIK